MKNENKQNSQRQTTYWQDKNGYNVRLPIEAYKSLNYLTRRKLRKVKNLQSLSVVEQVILNNFYTDGNDVLENIELGKNICFVCCAACQYYNLVLKSKFKNQFI